MGQSSFVRWITILFYTSNLVELSRLGWGWIRNICVLTQIMSWCPPCPSCLMSSHACAIRSSPHLLELRSFTPAKLCQYFANRVSPTISSFNFLLASFEKRKYILAKTLIKNILCTKF